MRCKKLLLRMVLCACLAQPTLVSAGAVTVPLAVKATASEAAEAAQAVIYKERAIKEREDSRQYSVKADTIAQETAAKLAAIKADLEEKKAAMPAFAKSEKEAAAAYAALKQQLEEARQASSAAWAEAKAAVRTAKVREAVLARRNEAMAKANEASKQADRSAVSYSAVETDQLLVMEEEIRQQEALIRQESSSSGSSSSGSSAQSDAWGAVEAAQWSVNRAYATAARLQSRAQDLDQVARTLQSEAEDRMKLMQSTYEAAAKMRQSIADGEYILNDTTTTADATKKESTRAKNAYVGVIDAQENPLPYRYTSTGLRMYNWRTGDDNGYQMIYPFAMSYFKKKGEYSNSVAISFDYIMASTEAAGRRGRMRGLSDTTLYLNRSRELEKYIINYTLTVNVPTGRRTLTPENRAALASEDLVQRSMFGEGWNFTPEISFSRKIGKEDLWTTGVSYSWRGAYDPTTDISGDDLKPGAQWRKFLRWRHAGQSWQFVGELAHVATAAGYADNGTRYDTGAEWLTRLTYRRVLPKRQDLVLYYWYDRETSNIAKASSIASPAHYFGAMWGKELDDSHKIRLSLDFMVATGARYESLYNVFVDRRDKQTLGVGYDIKLGNNQKLSLDAQLFHMKDGRDSSGGGGRHYNGWNVFITYGSTF